MNSKQSFTLKLYTHYGKWAPFTLNVEELLQLKEFVLLTSTKIIRLGSQHFHIQSCRLSFGSEREPTAYGIEMEPEEIITQINECLATA
ncbi:hypothetical protein [Pseudomonas sp. TE3610]